MSKCLVGLSLIRAAAPKDDIFWRRGLYHFPLYTRGIRLPPESHLIYAPTMAISLVFSPAI